MLARCIAMEEGVVEAEVEELKVTGHCSGWVMGREL